MVEYVAFGLVLQSDFDLPGLRVAGAADRDLPRVAVRRGVIRDAPTGGSWYSLAPGRSRLVWSEDCRISIEAGERIEIDYTGDDPGMLALVLLGATMTILLQQRGAFTVHASAVVLGGRAVAFAGDSGIGKSTLAHALVGRGHRLLTDDILPMFRSAEAGGPVHTAPGYAFLRMWPDSLAGAARDLDRHARLHANTEKRLVVLPAVAGDTERGTIPVDRVYVLAESDRLTIEELADLPKAVALLRHVYHPELVSGVRGASALLQDAVALAAGLRVFAVGRPTDRSALPELLERIEREA